MLSLPASQKPAALC